MEESSTIKQISEQLGCSKQNVSYHLKKLTEGLSDEEREAIVFQKGRTTMVTGYGLSLIKERIASSDKTLSPNTKQNKPNRHHQTNDKDLSYLANREQRSSAEYYEKMLSERDLEIERLRSELKEERRQLQIERERYRDDMEKERRELLNLQQSQKNHTESLLSLFSKAHERQQDTIDEFFERTTQLVSEQQKMIGDLAKTTQKLQENQQQLALIDRQPNNFELASLKQRIDDLESIKDDSASKTPAWTNTVLYIKAIWSIIKGE